MVDRPMLENDEMISRSEAARLLGCSKKTVWRYARNGLLREAKITRKNIKYSKKEVMDLLTQGGRK